MTSRGVVGIVAFAGVAVLALSGCPKDDSARTAGAKAIKSVTITSQPEGKTYHKHATAWAGVLEGAGYSVTVEASGISTKNIQRVNDGEYDVGFCTIAALYQGMNGIGWAEGKKYDNVRVLVPIKRSMLQLAAREDSGVRTYADLTGKIVNLGPNGSTPNFTFRAMFEELGVKPKKIVEAPFSDVAAVLADGRAQVTSDLDLAPIGKWVTQHESTPLIHLGLTKEQSAKIRVALPYLTPASIDQKAYPGMQAGVNTVAVWNVAIVRKDMDPATARHLVSTIIASRAKLGGTLGDFLTAENIADVTLPLHAGTVSYAESSNVKLDPNVKK